MTEDELFSILATISTHDEHGEHFTSRYEMSTLATLELYGLIWIESPLNSDGTLYSPEHWSVAVTERGKSLIAANQRTSPKGETQ